MTFYSIEFFTYLLALIAVYFSLPARFRWILLLCASYGFYISLRAEYALIMALTTAITYFAGLRMGGETEKNKRRRYFLGSLVANAGILFVFKYYNFSAASISSALAAAHLPWKVPAAHIILPVGISFYIFQMLSYSIDVYKGERPPERHAGIFALYVAFFPKLLAGPIERAKDLMDQFRERHVFDITAFTNGVKLIVWGLFKKVVVADRLAVFVDAVFDHPAGYEGLSLVVASVFYTFQIYCDFSGYTDMAIGIAQLLGFRLTDNFNRPYSARSVAEFWRRWHISLSTWLRDYLYIPLGGSRVTVARRCLNVMIVFFVCGLWHGANWTFVLWGMLHGVYLVVGLTTERFREKITAATGLYRLSGVRNILKILFTFALVAFAWIFFRANTLDDAFYIAGHLARGWGSLDTGGTLMKTLLLGRSAAEFVLVVALLGFVGIIHALERHDGMRRMFSGRPAVVRWGLYYILVLSVLLLSVASSERFIYFQF
jgi:alginate O-acetyltransferase complex protein AlgI